MTIAALAFLGAVVTVLVLQPVFKRAARAPTVQPKSGSADEHQQLSDQKERLLTALKDLEFEHKAGKLSDADYQSVKADDMAQLATIMTRMDQLTGKKVITSQPLDEAQNAATPLKCAVCQHENPPEAKFCLDCGNRLTTSVDCPSCGKTLPPEAKFCMDCGGKIET
jgi:rRNA maturation endonuclease Nob1